MAVISLSDVQETHGISDPSTVSQGYFAVNDVNPLFCCSFVVSSLFSPASAAKRSRVLRVSYVLCDWMWKRLHGLQGTFCKVKLKPEPEFTSSE